MREVLYPVQPRSWIKRTENLRSDQLLGLSWLRERLEVQEEDSFLSSFLDFLETACRKPTEDHLVDWFVFYERSNHQAVWKTRESKMDFAHSPSSLEKADSILKLLTGEMDLIARMPTEKLERIGQILEKQNLGWVFEDPETIIYHLPTIFPGLRILFHAKPGEQVIQRGELDFFCQEERSFNPK